MNTVWRERWGKGRVLLAKNDLRSAYDVFFDITNASKSLPHIQAEALTFQGDIFQRQEKFDDAILHYSEALDLSNIEKSTKARARLGMAQSLRSRGRRAGSITLCN